MDELGRQSGVGRLLLRGLAITSALAFLTLVMVQAWAFYAPPPKAEPPRYHLVGPGTKAAPVVHPPPLDEPEDRRLLAPATKAGTLGPLRLTLPPGPPPQPQGATRPQK